MTQWSIVQVEVYAYIAADKTGEKIHPEVKGEKDCFHLCSSPAVRAEHDVLKPL